MSTSITLRSEEDTERLARRVAGRCDGIQTIGLCGDLGAGKTTFARYLVSALGAPADEVSSPSFTLENEYRLPNGKVVEHWDLYRVHDLPMELIEPPAGGVLRIVEWPDRVPSFIDSFDLLLVIHVTATGNREVEVKGRSGTLLLESIAAT